MSQSPKQVGAGLPGYPARDPSMAGHHAQMARASSLGFTLVRAVPCLKKLVDPGHRDKGDALTDAEYDRLAAQPACPYVLGLDHSRLWRTGTGELFATADEYDLDLSDFERLRRAERDLGVTVTLSAHTMYAPGYTIMILARAPGSRVRVHLGDRQQTGATA